MKANEAPEKIHIQPNAHDRWFEGNKPNDNFVEYIRTDALIEKALKWYCLDCECNDNCKDSKCFFHNEYERYLKGETNALPPKFTNRILNEDGGTSDDWRYRHFTSKMQDSFIKKACDWFRRIDYDDSIPPFETTEEFIEGFKNYMKGE